MDSGLVKRSASCGSAKVNRAPEARLEDDDGLGSWRTEASRRVSSSASRIALRASLVWRSKAAILTFSASSATSSALSSASATVKKNLAIDWDWGTVKWKFSSFGATEIFRTLSNESHSFGKDGCVHGESKVGKFVFG